MFRAEPTDVVISVQLFTSDQPMQNELVCNDCLYFSCLVLFTFPCQLLFFSPKLINLKNRKNHLFTMVSLLILEAKLIQLKRHLLHQSTDSVSEFYQGPSWRVGRRLSICATTSWLWPGTILLLSSPTGVSQTCADMDPSPMDLCLREEPDVVTVSSLFFLTASNF